MEGQEIPRSIRPLAHSPGISGHGPVGGHICLCIAAPLSLPSRQETGETGHDLERVSVTKRYGQTVAVDGISHRFRAGSYVCLLGPSGCGSSSTLRMIAGHPRRRLVP